MLGIEDRYQGRPEDPTAALEDAVMGWRAKDDPD